MRRSRPLVLVCAPYRGEAARLKRLLSPRYRVVLSAVPFDALNVVLRGSFGAMVLALHRKDQSFLGMIPVLKKIRPDLPIIVVADGRSLEEQRSVQREGIFYFLPRPIEREEILAAVANAVEKGGRSIEPLARPLAEMGAKGSSEKG